MSYNTICHIEIEVADMDRAQQFYQGLFGWRFSSFIPDMRVFGIGDKHIGGLMKVEQVRPGFSPSVWFRVQNLDNSLQQAQALGGSIEAEKIEVPSVGWSGVIRDLDGNMIGLVQYTEDEG
jgi:predicted enzyme related to lactoylglutathione lyase